MYITNMFFTTLIEKKKKISFFPLKSITSFNNPAHLTRIHLKQSISSCTSESHTIRYNRTKFCSKIAKIFSHFALLFYYDFHPLAYHAELQTNALKNFQEGTKRH